jgi:hypothetical protein
VGVGGFGDEGATLYFLAQFRPAMATTRRNMDRYAVFLI